MEQYRLTMHVIIETDQYETMHNQSPEKRFSFLFIESGAFINTIFII